jgi:hypothetical protein
MLEFVLLYTAWFIGIFIVLEICFYLDLRTSGLLILFFVKNSRKNFLSALKRISLFFLPGLLIVYWWKVDPLVGILPGFFAWFAFMLLLADWDERVKGFISRFD